MDVQQLPPAGTRDDFGTVKEGETDWKTIATVWAGIKPLAGRELWNAQQVQADITTEVEVRYFPDLTDKMRFRHSATCKCGLGQKVFNILGVANIDQRNRRMIVSAKEIL